MSYHHVDPATVDPTPERPSVQRAVGDYCELENVALNLYGVAPGEEVPLAYRYHDEREEAFYVTEGRPHVETPDREYVVGEGEVFAATPGSPQFAHVPDDGVETGVLAVGAPAVDGDAHAYEGA